MKTFDKVAAPTDVRASGAVIYHLSLGISSNLIHLKAVQIEESYRIQELDIAGFTNHVNRMSEHPLHGFDRTECL